MPVHLGAITKDSPGSSLLSYLLRGGLDKADVVTVSKDKMFSHATYYMRDVATGDRIGKFVFTLQWGEKRKAWQVLDLDITLDSEEPVELHFLDRLSDSSDANEYYDVEAPEGQRLQIETVNRHSVNSEIVDTTRKIRASAFPFRLTVYDDMDALNEALGFTNRQIGNTDMTVRGLSDTFAAPGSLIQWRDDNGEIFSFVVGIVKSVREVSVFLGERTVAFVIIQLNSALGLLPVAAGREVFDLGGLAPGCAITMYADIKADFEIDK